MAEVEEKRSDLESFKSDVLTQLRELIYQCDLTLKAVSMPFKILLAVRRLGLIFKKRYVKILKGEGKLPYHRHPPLMSWINIMR